MISKLVCSILNSSSEPNHQGGNDVGYFPEDQTRLIRDVQRSHKGKVCHHLTGCRMRESGVQEVLSRFLYYFPDPLVTSTDSDSQNNYQANSVGLGPSVPILLITTSRFCSNGARTTRKS
jgi:hypothetical protein